MDSIPFTAPAGVGAAPGVLVSDGEAGASVGAAAGTIRITARIMAAIGAGDHRIMAVVSVAHTLTTAGVGAADGVAIIPAR